MMLPIDFQTMVYNNLTCEERADIVLTVQYQVFMALFCISSIVAFVLGIFVINKLRTRSFLHKNLETLLYLLIFTSLFYSAVIIATVFFHWFHIFIREDPCELSFLTTECEWSYYSLTVAMIAFVTIQACLTLERLLSTAFMHHYEKSTNITSVFLSILAVSLAISGAFWGLRATIPIEIQLNCGGIPNSTASTINMVYYIMLAVDAVSLAVFAACFAWNSKALSNYSLALRYQIQENMIVIKMLVPVVLLHFSVFLIYMGGTVILRISKPYIPSAVFPIIGMSLYLIPYYSAALNGLLYYILNNHVAARRKFLTKIAEEGRSPETLVSEKERYFKQLTEQWNTKIEPADYYKKS